MTGFVRNLVYDVGLHRGEDTDFYLKKGFDVVAVEANPELIAQCKVRFQEAIACGRLRLIEGAVAPASAGEKVTFYRNYRKPVWGTIEDAWAERNAKRGYNSERIETHRVDIGKVFSSFGIPFYLKVDIEGVDRLVLESLKKFATRPRYVSIEAETANFAKLQAEVALLHDLGYTKFRPVQQQTIPGTMIRTKRLDGSEMEHIFEQEASGPFGEDIPQQWLSFDDTLREYERIFRRHCYFSDDSPLSRYPISIQKMFRVLYRIWTGHRGPLPGWYDTHASM